MNAKYVYQLFMQINYAKYLDKTDICIQLYAVHCFNIPTVSSKALFPYQDTVFSIMGEIYLFLDCMYKTCTWLRRNSTI